MCQVNVNIRKFESESLSDLFILKGPIGKMRLPIPIHGLDTNVSQKQESHILQSPCTLKNEEHFNFNISAMLGKNHKQTRR
jgi:hypothetical protein